MIKNILFDWDGTLVHSLPFWLETCRRVFDDFDIHFPEAKFKEFFFSSSNSIECLAGEKYKQISDTLFNNVDIWMREIEMKEEICETLRILRDSDLNMVLVTSSYGPTVESALAKNGATCFFDKVLGFEDVRNHKPNPEVIHRAMEFLGANKEETMIVGDSYADMLAGKNAGIKTCFYYPSENREFYQLSEEILAKMELIIENFSEIVNII